MKKIRLGLSTKTPQELIDQGNQIKTGMTGNPNFTTPSPTLVVFGGTITDLSAKLSARQLAVDAAKQATEALHAAVAAYDGSVTALGTYAETITGGDAVKLASANFELRGSPVPVTELGQVQNLRLSVNGFPGKLKARWDALHGAKVYDVQVTATPDTEASWRSIVPSPASNTTVDGLVSGARTYVRVRGVAKRITGPFSNAVGCIVP